MSTNTNTRNDFYKGMAWPVLLACLACTAVIVLMVLTKPNRHATAKPSAPIEANFCPPVGQAPQGFTVKNGEIQVCEANVAGAPLAYRVISLNGDFKITLKRVEENFKSIYGKEAQIKIKPSNGRIMYLFPDRRLEGSEIAELFSTS